MAAYLIAEFDVTDCKAFEGYRPVVIPLLEKHGAEILGRPIMTAKHWKGSAGERM